jgi:TonB family protein
VIDGLAAEGRRATTVIPAGAAGNDRPLNLVQEAWISSDLWTQVLFTRSDPRTGEFTLQLTNIKREEPDSSLFVPPPDYRVLEVPSGFSFSFGAFQVLGGLDPSDITTPPVAITRTDPDYTDDARQAKISGTVLVTAMIGVDGIPSDIRVTKSLDPGLDRKAMEAVAKWRFRPATRNGQAVRAPVTIELTFKVR